MTLVLSTLLLISVLTYVGKLAAPHRPPSLPGSAHLLFHRAPGLPLSPLLLWGVMFLAGAIFVFWPAYREMGYAILVLTSFGYAGVTVLDFCVARLAPSLSVALDTGPPQPVSPPTPVLPDPAPASAPVPVQPHPLEERLRDLSSINLRLATESDALREQLASAKEQVAALTQKVSALEVALKQSRSKQGSGVSGLNSLPDNELEALRNKLRDQLTMVDQVLILRGQTKVKANTTQRSGPSLFSS